MTWLKTARNAQKEIQPNKITHLNLRRCGISIWMFFYARYSATKKDERNRTFLFSLTRHSSVPLHPHYFKLKCCAYFFMLYILPWVYSLFFVKSGFQFNYTACNFSWYSVCRLHLLLLFYCMYSSSLLYFCFSSFCANGSRVIRDKSKMGYSK